MPFSNSTNVYTDPDNLGNGLCACLSDYDIDGVRSSLWTGLTVIAVTTILVGMFLLLADLHFSRPICATLSLLFFVSLGWVAVMLSWLVGIGLAVVAIVMRRSWLLFPKGTELTSN